MSIGITTAVLFAVFAALLFLGCPISVGIVISSIVAAVSSLSWDQITFITMQKMNSGVESFSLLAIPLFILAGNIMNNGGIAKTPCKLRSAFVGWCPGSLALANIVGNMLFGALSGSSVAAASAMGGCIYDPEGRGYDPALQRQLICFRTYRSSDSANQRIYRIFHGCRRSIYFHTVYGRLCSRTSHGAWFYGCSFFVCKNISIQPQAFHPCRLQ